MSAAGPEAPGREDPTGLARAMERFRFTTTRPVAVLVVFLAVMVFGAFSVGRLPLDLMPDIAYPKLTVRTEYPGAAPAEVENDVSRPIEEILGVVGGLTRIESVSRAGYSDVILEFAWDADMDEAGQDVLEKLDTIEPVLPDGAKQPLILRYDPSLDPVLTLGVSGEGARFSGIAGLKYMRRIADRDVRRLLEPVEGVAAVKVKGGLDEEIVVEVLEDELRRTGLGMEAIAARLAAENINLAGGSLRDGRTRYLVRTVNEFKSLDDLRDVVIETREGRDIRLRDVAEVRSGYKDREVITRINGKDAVEVEIYREADANIVDMAKRVRNKLETSVGPRLMEQYGARIQVVSDRSRFIESSVAQVRDTALVGGVLAVLVLFLFLRDFKSTLIVAVAIPISILVTFAPMNLAGVSLNIMSLGGLALGVGMLVDNSIVVLESIHRCREEGDGLVRATIRGTAEVGGAVTASTLTSVAVFFPMVFVEGVAGQMFGDLGLAVVFSLLASLAVALFFIPMLASRKAPSMAGAPGPDVLGPGAAFARMWRSWAAGAELRGALTSRHRLRGLLLVLPAAYVLLRFALHLVFELVGKVLASLALLLGALLVLLRRALAWVLRMITAPVLAAFNLLLAGLERLYPPVIRWGLRHPLPVYGLALASFAGMIYGASRLDTELIPEVHQGEFTVEMSLPVGTPIEVTDEVTRGVEVPLMERVPFLARLTTIVGSEGDEVTTGERGEHTARLRVNLAGERIEPKRPTVATDATSGAGAAAGKGGGRRRRGRMFGGRRGRRRGGGGGGGRFRKAPPPKVEVVERRAPLADPARAEARAIRVVREIMGKIPDAVLNITRPVLFSFKTPVEVEVRGHDLGDLAQATHQVAEQMAALDGLSDVRPSIQPGSPEVQIEYDRDELARRNLDIRKVAELVRDKIQGNEATEYNRRDRKVPVRVRLANARELSVQQLRDIVVNPGAAHPVPLSAVAKLTVGRGPNEIRRIDQQRVGVVTANLQGVALGTMAGRLQDMLEQVAPHLPDGVTTAVTGQSEEWEVSARSMTLALGLAIFLVYVIMASQFESLVYPVIILLTVPLAFAGVVLVLWALQIPLSVVVFLGAIMLAGIVVNNAIVLVDYVGQLKARGYGTHEALEIAGRVRLRPILMTTMTTVLGLLPMALGLGDGAEIRTPMAITVIAGLAFSTVLTLVVIPTLYAGVDGLLGRRGPSSSELLAEDLARVTEEQLAPEVGEAPPGDEKAEAAGATASDVPRGGDVGEPGEAEAEEAP